MTAHNRHAALPFDPSRGASRSLLTAFGTIAVAVVSLLAWSNYAMIDISAMGNGQVIPHDRIQVVQNLEGGIMKELLVKEGETVTKDQPLARFSDVEFTSSLGEADETYAGEQAQIARLQAEVATCDALARGRPGGALPSFKPALNASHPELVAKETQLFTAHLANLRTTLESAAQVETRAREAREKARQDLPILRDSLVLLGKQREIIEPQVANGVASKLDLLNLDQRALELRGKLVEAQRDERTAASELEEAESKRHGELEKARGEALAQLTELTVKVRALESQLGNLRDRVSRRQLTAPVNGVVKRIFVNTANAVLRPGDQVLEIVPSDEERVVEARFAPQDIAFVQTGQPAYIRITAYDASIYGAMPAVVSRVSADATTGPHDEIYYLVQVRAKQPLRDARGQELPIKPGMVAQVDVLTGKRSLFAYWTKPIAKLHYTALHER